MIERDISKFCKLCRIGSEKGISSVTYIVVNRVGRKS